MTPPVLNYALPPTRPRLRAIAVSHALGCGLTITIVHSIPMVIRSVNFLSSFPNSSPPIPLSIALSPILGAVIAPCIASAASAACHTSLLRYYLRIPFRVLRRGAWISAAISGAAGFPGFGGFLFYDRLPAALSLFLGAAWFSGVIVVGSALSVKTIQAHK